jgi:hypothetical protein
MRSKIQVKASALLQDLDKFIAIFGIIISVFLIIWGGVISSIKSPLVGVLLFLSCFLWLQIRKSDSFKFHLPENKTLLTLGVICFFFLYGLSIISVYFRPNLYERPLLYFILTALMAGAIAFEILAADRRHAVVILIQVLILGTSITWTQQMITPGLVGIDPWYHMSLTNKIIDGGFLPSDYSYSALPFFHLIVATTSLITTLTYKFAALVSVSFGQITCNAFFVFLIANYLFKNFRIGLLAALLVIVANLHILMSYWSIPNAFGAVFIPIILYLLFTNIKDTSRLNVSILLILTMIASILTHSIVAMCIIVILFVAWGASALYQFFSSKTEDNISLLIPVGYTLGVISWWSYVANYLGPLAMFFGHDFSLFSERGTITKAIAITPLPGEYIFSILGENLFLIISLIGIFYMISKKGSRSTFCIALVSVSVLCLPFIAYFTQSEIISDRWLYIAQILLSLPLALALFLVGTWKIKKPVYIYLFFCIFIVTLSFLTFMSPTGNNDSHTLTPSLGTISNFYTQSEISGSDFFAKNSVGVLSSDFNYAYNPSSSIFENMYGINRERLKMLDLEMSSGEFIHDGSIKILRSRQITNLQRTGEFSSTIRPDIDTYLVNSGFDKIYDNSVMTGYIG